VREISRRGSGWDLRTSSGIAPADFCIVATGARNPLRDVGTEMRPHDTCRPWATTFPATRSHRYPLPAALEGYIWIFPRCGHLSIGICGKNEPAASLRQRLERFMTERGIAWKGSAFYSHLLPSLDAGSWHNNRVAGEGWMAVGDAAGLVDPLTGEGLYYAIRSADLAARALLAEVGEVAGKLRQYRETLRRDFAANWNSARGSPSASLWAASCAAP